VKLLVNFHTKHTLRQTSQRLEKQTNLMFPIQGALRLVLIEPIVLPQCVVRSHRGKTLNHVD
jgi:hypothetical protein